MDKTKKKLLGLVFVSWAVIIVLCITLAFENQGEKIADTVAPVVSQAVSENVDVTKQQTNLDNNTDPGTEVELDMLRKENVAYRNSSGEIENLVEEFIEKYYGNMGNCEEQERQCLLLINDSVREELFPDPLGDFPVKEMPNSIDGLTIYTDADCSNPDALKGKAFALFRFTLKLDDFETVSDYVFACDLAKTNDQWVITEIELQDPVIIQH